MLWNAGMWQSLFHLAIPVTEKVLRTACVYFSLVALLRLFGKRELAQLNPFDLVVLLSLSNTVQNALIGDDNSVIGGIIGAFSLLAINYVTVRFIFRHRRLDQLIEGKPTVLIKDGAVQRDALTKEMLTESELLTVAHRQGFSTLENIQTCVLEPGGSFFIESKHPSSDERYRAEVLARLAALSNQLSDLQGLLNVRAREP
jgi:uncharacterized membrane protein YcaP (DUF421 family)